MKAPPMRSQLPTPPIVYAGPRCLRASRCTPAAIAAMLSTGCIEPLPPVSLDFSNHDQCAYAVPYVVDASASEIQCLVEDYVYVTYVGEDGALSAEGMNVPGPPACCEVCATRGTADDACKAMCKHELCARAYDEHYSMARRATQSRSPMAGSHIPCFHAQQGSARHA